MRLFSVRSAGRLAVRVLGALFLAMAPLTPTLAAQSAGTLQGRITDAGTGQPVVGAQVRLLGTTIGTVSRDDGRFTLPNVPAGRYTVEVRRIGYEPSRTADVVVAAGATATLDVTLTVSTLRLADVVVTGVVDPTSGRNVPFTVAKIDTSLLQVPNSNAIGALQGKVAGATIVTASQPGTGVNVQLRSPASISKSNFPLLVVDGVILAQSSPGTADLNALDIESIELVKGAAAASLYGSRASNGVIQIRTKRGTSLPQDRTEVYLRTEFGQSGLPRAIDYARYHHFQLNAAGQYVDASGAPVPRDQRIEKPAATRFQDEVYPDRVYDQIDRFFEGSPFALTTLALSRNSGATNWRASLSNNLSDGIVAQAGSYRRTDFRLNLDHRFSDRLQLSVSGYHARSDRDIIDDGGDGPFFDLINQAPDVDLRQPDEDGTPFIFQPDPVSQGARPNPLYVLSVQDWKEQRARTLGSMDLRYAATSWLNLEANVSYDRADQFSQFFYPREAKTAEQSLDAGEITRDESLTTALNASLTATALKQFGRLTTRATLRGLLEREDRDLFDVTANNLAVVGLPTLESGLAITSSSFASAIRTDGVFGLVGLDWDGKYIGDVLIRRDGSSLFGPEEHWQSYYRVSGAWRVAEETWWPVPSVNEFKLRYSQGTAGGRPSFSDQFETYDIGVGGVLTKSTLGNPFLRPELATEREYGLDLIWRNRYSLQLTHARSRVVDQLLQVPLPASAGYRFQWQNAGTVEGNAWEATVEAQIKRTGAVQWDMGFVADRVRNEIVGFDRPCFRTGTTGFQCSGVTLGVMYGSAFVNDAAQLPEALRDAAGAFDVNDDGLLVPVGEGGSWRDGAWGTTVSVGDQNLAWGIPLTLKAASGSDSTLVIGDGNPAWRWGWSNTVRWKGITVFALLDAQVGGETYNRTKQRMYQYFRSADIDQVGKAEEAKKPVQYYSALYNANSVVDWFVEDAGFVKLRELSVKYALPSRLLAPLRRTGVRGGSFALVGRNLITWTDYSGYDPEVGTPRDRLDDFVYPAFRTITGSLELVF